ncbi:MAG: hypothetical protein MUF87_05675 [Anaerolineae bacterium]|nr:hypothetical protein [Anaerolineae bacterium]
MRILTFMLLLLGISACAAPEAPRALITPFPTVTPGRIVTGLLPLSDDFSDGGLSPATAVALARQPTATPDFSNCLSLSSEQAIESTPAVSSRIINEEIVRYLSSGGDLAVFRETLTESWGIIGETGYIRSDLDLTGEGVPEILIGYTVPEGLGELLIVGCAEGTYRSLFELTSDTQNPPQLITIGDLNRGGINKLMIATPYCERDNTGQIVNREECPVKTELLVWQQERDRFDNLLPDDVISTRPPELNDIDQDQVSEVIVRLESNGTEFTGPLRTGVEIYDWDGSSYVLSIIQLDPPRFMIQVIQQADVEFARREYATAIALYQQAFTGTGLRYWFDDEVEILRSYTLYRLILAQVITSSPDHPLTFQQLTTLYPDRATAPIYAALAYTFYTEFQTSGNLIQGCTLVQAEITARPQALDLLNRYGSRSPRYNAIDLCPIR